MPQDLQQCQINFDNEAQLSLSSLTCKTLTAIHISHCGELFDAVSVPLLEVKCTPTYNRDLTLYSSIDRTSENILFTGF